MLRVYSAAEVHAALPWAALADALHAAFVGGDVHAPLRHAHKLGDGASLLLMPAWSGRALGVKLVTVMPQAATRGAATVQASYLLCDRDSGQALALLDGEALTQRRTAAASALAARHLARTDARRLLLVGAGSLAPWLARAHAALRPALEQVRVWARHADAARTLATQLQGEGLAAEAADDLEQAVREADLISCVTTSTEPLVRGAWLAPGTHLDLVGGFRPDMREVDDDAVSIARVVVDTRAGALAEAGDLVQPLARGRIAAAHVRCDLAELLRGEGVGRADNADITLFKSVGCALEDLAAAQLVLARAPA